MSNINESLRSRVYNDIVNISTERIISGQRLPSSLVAVHSQDELVGYGGIFVGYGIWADAIHYSLTRRHLEALRYHRKFTAE